MASDEPQLIHPDNVAYLRGERPFIVRTPLVEFNLKILEDDSESGCGGKVSILLLGLFFLGFSGFILYILRSEVNIFEHIDGFMSIDFISLASDLGLLGVFVGTSTVGIILGLIILGASIAESVGYKPPLDSLIERLSRDGDIVKGTVIKGFTDPHGRAFVVYKFRTKDGYSPFMRRYFLPLQGAYMPKRDDTVYVLYLDTDISVLL